MLKEQFWLMPENEGGGPAKCTDKNPAVHPRRCLPTAALPLLLAALINNVQEARTVTRRLVVPAAYCAVPTAISGAAKHDGM